MKNNTPPDYEALWQRLKEHLPAIKDALTRIWFHDKAHAALAFIEAIEKEERDGAA